MSSFYKLTLNMYLPILVNACCSANLTASLYTVDSTLPPSISPPPPTPLTLAVLTDNEEETDFLGLTIPLLDTGVLPDSDLEP